MGTRQEMRENDKREDFMKGLVCWADKTGFTPGVRGRILENCQQGSSLVRSVF